jgi:coenzyme F420-reducing hydrogenase gamma subunit
MSKKLRVATTSLAGCFGCHMSFLDIDERLLTLLELVEFDRSPITDIKHCSSCDIGIIEGGICNAEFLAHGVPSQAAQLPPASTWRGASSSACALIGRWS